MDVFLITDYCRIDSETGDFAEAAFREDLVKHRDAISLVSARNQYVSFQLAVDCDKGETVDSFDLSFTPLEGKNGVMEPDYEVYIEWFHRINGITVPDLLVPYGKTELEFRVPLDNAYHAKQRAGALWIDLFVPEQTVKGRYAGTLTATVNGEEHAFQVQVKVYRSMVPYESLLMADFNNYADNISPNYPHLASNPARYRDGSYLKVERQFYRMARDHRCLFQNLNYLHSGVPVETFAPELEGSGKTIRVKSWERFDEHFGPYLDGSAFRGSRRGEMPIEFLFTPFNLGWPADYRKFGEKGFKTEYRRILWEYMRHFEDKGWTKTVLEIMFNNKKAYRFFPTTQDEIWYEHDEEILDYMYDVMRDTYEHSAAQFVFRADSTNHYHNHTQNKYADVFGMWVAGATFLEWMPETVLQMRNRRSILWHYGWPGEGMTIDLPLHAFAVNPMMCVMMGTSGFCSFWNAVSWGENYLETPFVNGGQGIFYPGEHFGTEDLLPSIRLKVMRNQMQLGDLMMTANGLDCETLEYVWSDLKGIVNECFGYDGMDSWWRPKPDFLDTQPRYWKYGGMKGNNHIDGHSPKLIEDLRRGVLRRLG